MGSVTIVRSALYCSATFPSIALQVLNIQVLHSNIDEELKSSLLINNKIHRHNTRTNNQMSILRVNRSKTKHCVLHNYMITWNSLPDIFKVNVSVSMFKSKVRNFYLKKYSKILMLGATMIEFYFLTCLQLRFFKCNCFLVLGILL